MLGSPIWDPEFTGKTPAHVIAASQAATATEVTASKKRPLESAAEDSEGSSDGPEAKRTRSEDADNLDEAVAEIGTDNIPIFCINGTKPL